MKFLTFQDLDESVSIINVEKIESVNIRRLIDGWVVEVIPDRGKSIVIRGFKKEEFKLAKEMAKQTIHSIEFSP